MRRKSLWGPTGWLCSFFILSLCFSSVGLCDMIPDEGTDNEELFNRGGAYAFDTFQRYDRVFVYTLFRSGDGPTPVDGDSGSGVFCSPGAGGVATGPSSVVFMDSCGAGSALRGVSTRGLFTIAGSLTERGFVNGAPSQTLFGGLSSGGPINGIALVGDKYYLADTTNNAIRVIDKTVGTSSTYVNKGLKNPSFVAPYNMPLGGANLFVSDTGNNRVLFVPTGIASPPLSVALSGFYPGTLAVSNALSTLFYVRSSSTIAAASLSDLDNTWVVGNASCTGYVNSLLLTGTNDAELMYYGQGTDGENQVFSLPTSTNYGECPNVMFQWPYTDPNRTVRLMVTRDATSWFVITSTSVYVASLKSLPYLDSSLEDSSDFATRQPMAASFPRAAFPTDNSTLMSELYSWMMKDISIALGTTRYGVEMQMNRTFYDTHGSIANNVLVISPEMEKNWWNSDMIDRIEHNTDYLSVLIPGSFNVSTWGDGITGFTSKDGSIEILPLLGPLGMSTSEGQKRLKDSPWYWTRRFLDGLRNNDDDSTYSDLGPFCTYTCGLHCYNEEAHRQMCAGYPGCDDVCKGAIGASTVLGTSFVALGVLGVLNPLNLLNAFTMVPVF